MTPDEKRAARIKTAPVSFQGLLSRAMSGKCARSQAIKAMCAECNGFEREAIANCTAYACPLWHFRPFQKRAAK